MVPPALYVESKGLEWRGQVERTGERERRRRRREGERGAKIRRGRRKAEDPD